MAVIHDGPEGGHDMTLRSIVLAFVLVTALSLPAFAQVPYIKVYADDTFSSTYHCGTQGVLHEFIVVLHNVPDVVSAVDFTIQYPPTMTWIGDQLPDARYVSKEVITIGSSPTGIAVAWHNCCMQAAPPGEPLVVLRPLIMWTGNCNFGCDTIEVSGYAPLGKQKPSYVRASDFTEHDALGMFTANDYCGVAVEPTTWGRVKALYR